MEKNKIKFKFGKTSLRQEFIRAQKEAEKNGVHDFMCPICGKTAHWERSSKDGKLHQWCDKCVIFGI